MVKGKRAGELRQAKPKPDGGDPAPASAEPKASVAVAEPPASEPKPIPETSDRLSFKLTPEGRIDTSSLRKSTEERARTAIAKSVSDPDFRKWAGLEASAGPSIQPLEIVAPALIGNLLDLQVSVEAALLAKKSGLEYAEVRKILAWTVHEHEVLDKQGANLANKYIPVAWLEKMDVMIFLATLVSLTAMKIGHLRDYTKTKFDRQVSAPTHDEKPKQAAPEKETFNPVSMETPHPGSAASANGASA